MYRLFGVLALAFCLWIVTKIDRTAAMTPDDSDYATGRASAVGGEYQAALILFRRLAQKGHSGAQNNLGKMYANGQGTPRDLEVARMWFLKAAAAGEAEAQYNLAVIYLKGLGVQQDIAEAASWYRKAAERDYAEAQYALGTLYANGEGVLQDFATAYVWWNIAAANGVERAKELREAVAKFLTEAQQVDAQQRAKRCMASGYTDCD